jgi:hypothetical protein
MEIQDQRSQLEHEVQGAHAELSSLQHERDFFDRPGTAIIPTSAGTGVSLYHNVLMPDSLIESVIRDNRSRKAQSEPAPSGRSFCHIVDLQGFWAAVDSHCSRLSLLFSAKLTTRLIISDKQHELARAFCDRIRAEPGRLIDEYAERVGSVEVKWPKEFPPGKPRTGDVHQLVAADQPMLMTKAQKSAYCFYDTNGVSDDPQADFDEYRARISWSDEEKRKYLAKYGQHGKKFKLIAASLPLKTVKDVIEFYYVNRFRLDLKDRDSARRKRGKKKVLSEGGGPMTLSRSNSTDKT